MTLRYVSRRDVKYRNTAKRQTKKTKKKLRTEDAERATGYLRDGRVRKREAIWKKKEARFREIKGDKARDYKRFISLDGTPRRANGTARARARSCLRVSVWKTQLSSYTPSSSTETPSSHPTLVRHVKAADEE